MKIPDNTNDHTRLAELAESFPDHLLRRCITQLLNCCFVDDHGLRTIRSECPGEIPARGDLHAHLAQVVIVPEKYDQTGRLHLSPLVFDLASLPKIKHPRHIAG